MGVGSGLAWAIAVGLGGEEPLSCARDSDSERLCVGGAASGSDTRPEMGVAAGMAAEADPGVGESAGSAGFDRAGSTGEPASSAGPAVGDGGAFKALVSCGSLLRSVFDKPAGLDLAIWEDILGYAVAGKRNSRHNDAKAKIIELRFQWPAPTYCSWSKS